MTFKLSERSLNNLRGVHPDLVACVHMAIELTKIDFGVICGLRTLEEQKELVATGASQTMNSKHLRQGDGYGHAVDLMAYVGSRASWENNLYDDIADAMKEASQRLSVSLKWGAAWSVGSISSWPHSMEAAMNSYIDLRRSQGRRPFIDGPHFELMV